LHHALRTFRSNLQNAEVPVEMERELRPAE
jgi:hypothetical protein